MKYSCFLGVFLLMLGGSLPAQAQDALFTNGHIVDPESETVVHGSILVKDGRIEAVGEIDISAFEGEVIDLEEGWVIPGLVDMHTHSYGNMGPSMSVMDMVMTTGVARRMLYAGTTHFLDLFSAEAYIFQIRNQQREGNHPGASIFAAGPILTATGGHGTEYGIPTRVINTPEEAKSVVDSLAKSAPDVVKIVYDNQSTYFPTIDQPTLEAAVEASHQHDIPVVVHIGTWDDLRDASQLGVAAVTHTPAGSPPEDIAALMVENNVAIIPTMVVQTEFRRIALEPEVLEDPMLEKLTHSAFLEAYRDTAAYPDRFKGFIRWQANFDSTVYDAVGQLAAGGVTILTGTDAGNPGVFQGYSVHRELELLVEAGLSNWQALRAGSTDAGSLLGLSLGLQAGDEASFVVLDASPLESISNTKRIRQVIQGGIVVDRANILP